MPQIALEHITVSYKNKKEQITALSDVSIDFASDLFHVIVGYSGCGKTTLLKTIAGLLVYNGKILFDGKDAINIDIRERQMALVSQQYILYPQMTIFDNIAFPLLAAHIHKKEITKRVYAIANSLDLTYCLTRKPKQLSGGQQQRVALARALVKQPSLCLLDEPLSNTDAQARTEQRHLIRRVLKDIGCTALYVTHDIKEAMALADNLVVMNNGKIEISGPPKEVYESENKTVKSLFTIL